MMRDYGKVKKRIDHLRKLLEEEGSDEVKLIEVKRELDKMSDELLEE